MVVIFVRSLQFPLSTSPLLLPLSSFHSHSRPRPPSKLAPISCSSSSSSPQMDPQNGGGRKRFIERLGPIQRSDGGTCIGRGVDTSFPIPSYRTSSTSTTRSGRPMALFTSDLALNPSPGSMADPMVIDADESKNKKPEMNKPDQEISVKNSLKRNRALLLHELTAEDREARIDALLSSFSASLYFSTLSSFSLSVSPLSRRRRDYKLDYLIPALSPLTTMNRSCD